MSERDEIIKALRDVPGVFELNSDPSVTVFQRKWVAGGVGVGYYTESGSLVIQSCETKRNATLAEAVAALTPPAQPNPPTYDYVAGLKGVKAKKRAENGIVNYVDYDGLPVATPKTRLEVIMLVWCLWYGLK